jgi:hypothetical protein
MALTRFFSFQEDRIMELIQEHSICPSLIKSTIEYHQFYSQATKICAAQVSHVWL